MEKSREGIGKKKLKLIKQQAHISDALLSGYIFRYAEHYSSELLVHRHGPMDQEQFKIETVQRERVAVSGVTV